MGTDHQEIKITADRLVTRMAVDRPGLKTMEVHPVLHVGTVQTIKEHQLVSCNATLRPRSLDLGGAFDMVMLTIQTILQKRRNVFLVVERPLGAVMA